MALDIISTINLDLKRPNTETVYAVQYDTAGRIKAQLTNDGEAWHVPTSAGGMVSFRKSDNIGGFYDTTELGEVAVSVDENDDSVIYIALDAQTTITATPLDHPVQMQINFYNSQGKRLSTFAFYLRVQASVLYDGDQDERPVASEWTFRILTGALGQTIKNQEEAIKWMEDNIRTQEGYVVDDTLKVEGAAGDAKKIGELFEEIVKISDSMPGYFPTTDTERVGNTKYYTRSGTSPNYVYTEFTGATFATGVTYYEYSPWNRIWIDPDDNDVAIPTMDDLDELNRQISDIDNEIYSYTQFDGVIKIEQIMESNKVFASDLSGNIDYSGYSGAKMSCYLLPVGTKTVWARKMRTQYYALYASDTIEGCNSTTSIGGVKTIDVDTTIIIPSNAKLIIFEDNAATIDRRGELKGIKTDTEEQSRLQVLNDIYQEINYSENVSGELITRYYLDPNVGYVISSSSAASKMVVFDVTDTVSVEFTTSVGYAFFITDDPADMQGFSRIGEYSTHNYTVDGNNVVSVPDGAKTLVLDAAVAPTYVLEKSKKIVNGISYEFAYALLDCLKNVAWINENGLKALDKLKRYTEVSELIDAPNDKTGTVYDINGITAVFDSTYALPTFAQYIGSITYSGANYGGAIQGGLYRNNGILYQIQNGGLVIKLNLNTMSIVGKFNLPTGFGSDHFTSVDWIVKNQKFVVADGSNAYIYDITSETNISVDTIALDGTHTYGCVAFDSENQWLYCIEYADTDSPRSHYLVSKYDLSSYMSSGALEATLIDSFQIAARHMQDSCFFNGQIRVGIDRPTGPNVGAYSMFGIQSINPNNKGESVVNIPMKEYRETEVIAVVDDAETPYMVMAYATNYSTGHYYKVIP